MSLLKGFSSLFDWMFPPKTYQELSDDLDIKMQELYDRCGWGKYNNPLQGYQNAVDITRAAEEEKSFMKSLGIDNPMTVDEYLATYQPCQFTPGTFYNEDMDAIEVIFKNESYYVQPLNQAIELYLTFETNEVVGLNILQLKKLLKDKILPEFPEKNNETH